MSANWPEIKGPVVPNPNAGTGIDGASARPTAAAITEPASDETA